MIKNIAVITGAGTGIGRATAQRLAQAGFNLVLIGRNATRLEKTAQSLEQYTVQCTICPADICNGDELIAIADRIEKNIGDIDSWVNCAGAGLFGETASLSPKDIQRAFNVTCMGSINGTLAALHCMRRRGYGHIINLDLDVTLRDLPLTACENASRAALRSFCQSLRAEIAHNKDRISVTMVELPNINTPHNNWTKNTSGKMITPLGPVYEPQVAAQAICQAIFSPSESIAIGPRNILGRIVGTFFPGLRKLWIDNYGYEQLSHDWYTQDHPNDLYESPDVPYGEEGPYDAQACRQGSPMSIIISSKMRHIGRYLLIALGLGLLAKHCHHERHQEHKNNG